MMAIVNICVVCQQKEPVPHDYDNCDPEHKTIYRFIRMLFNAAQLTAECAIVTLVGDLLPWVIHCYPGEILDPAPLVVTMGS